MSHFVHDQGQGYWVKAGATTLARLFGHWKAQKFGVVLQQFFRTEGVDLKIQMTCSRRSILVSFCLRKLNSLAVDQQVLQLFYSSALSSVLAFGLSSWGGNIRKRDYGTLDRIIKKSSSVVGRTQDGLDILYMTDEWPRNWRTYWRRQHTL